MLKIFYLTPSSYGHVDALSSHPLFSASTYSSLQVNKYKLWSQSTDNSIFDDNHV